MGLVLMGEGRVSGLPAPAAAPPAAAAAVMARPLGSSSSACWSTSLLPASVLNSVVSSCSSSSNSGAFFPVGGGCSGSLLDPRKKGYVGRGAVRRRCTPHAASLRSGATPAPPTINHRLLPAHGSAATTRSAHIGPLPAALVVVELKLLAIYAQRCACHLLQLLQLALQQA